MEGTVDREQGSEKRLPEYTLRMSAHLRDYLIFILDRGLVPELKTGESECLRHALIELAPDPREIRGEIVSLPAGAVMGSEFIDPMQRNRRFKTDGCELIADSCAPEAH